MRFRLLLLLVTLIPFTAAAEDRSTVVGFPAIEVDTCTEPAIIPCGGVCFLPGTSPAGEITSIQAPAPPFEIFNLRYAEPGCSEGEPGGVGEVEAGCFFFDMLFCPTVAGNFTSEVVVDWTVYDGIPPSMFSDTWELSGIAFGSAAPAPTVWGCAEADGCDTGCLGDEVSRSALAGGGSASAAGGGPGLGPAGSGPGAELRYQAGGAGSSAYPRPADWSTSLGRFWSHDYAQAIVPDPDASHVWLLTRWSTFRVFDDPGLDGIYETAVPSSEGRRLVKTAAGWELSDLDGTVERFDSSGRWTETVDRHGNAKVASYTGSVLSSVAFPDGRQETFSYHPGGKLAAITEVGVDLTTTRTWSYTWSGDDLARIDRPDGTAWEMSYGDGAHPGYMTLLELVGTDADRRVEQGWELDAEGNVVRTWKGAADAASPDAVAKWSLVFDDPAMPTEATVTDPLGVEATYRFERDPASRKPRITAVSDGCATCGIGPEIQRSYDDPQNPLLPTEEIDGRGVVTRFTYDADGRMTSRIEAFGDALERETTWEYGPAFPALMSAMVEPSTTGEPLDLRRLSISYDAAGNPVTRTVEGLESGQAFSYSTLTTFTAEGLPNTIDPPGYGTADEVRFVYDPARGNLLPSERLDPLVGATSFTYDAFNRRVSVSDPNGVATEKVYDALDRLRFSIRRGAVPAEDLVTEHRYDAFGDLFQTVLPEGNVVEYGYDPAGRLISVERKADADPASHGARALYTLDGAGNRVREEQQRWDSGWVTESETVSEYSTRCRPDRVIAAPGSPEESVTEYAYDCAGNLERVWDANHPSAGQTEPASTAYAYDALGRLTSLTRPWGGAGGGDEETRFEYDVQDHRSRITDGEGTVTILLTSDRDLVTEESSEVSGTTSFTYNEHAQLIGRTDARGVSSIRTVDALDRVTGVSFPDSGLDIAFTYDDPAVAFSLGRITRIDRHGRAIDYAYDRFGRLTRDGELTYAWGRNGQRLEVGYPGGATAVYVYDFADRPVSLEIQGLSAPGPVLGSLTQPLVTTADYRASGLLASLTFGNGLVETRAHDPRDVLAGLTVTGASTVFHWSYTTDASGQVTGITDALDPAAGRTYSYQDFQYFLEQGNGPWGSLSWTYDRLGGRLSETRDGGAQDSYLYPANAATAGNVPQLEEIQLGGGGNRALSYDAAGNLLQVSEGAGAVDLSYDDAGRLASIDRPSAGLETRLLYDGRGFLFRSIGNGSDVSPIGIFCDGFDSGDLSAWVSGGSTCPAITVTEATYSSAGDLRGLSYAGSTARRQVFDFAGRPVAILNEDAAGTRSWSFLTTDHLGTPVLATDESGAVRWSGGFEPFGADDGAARAEGIFLRFPGQWVDETWSQNTPGTGLYYNAKRWYAYETGRYSRPDPLGIAGGINPALYAGSNSLNHVDEQGLAYFAKRRLRWLPWLGFLSCNPISDLFNVEISHEQLFFEDGQDPRNQGFFKRFFKKKGVVKEDTGTLTYHCNSRHYDDCIMRQAMSMVPARSFCMLGVTGGKYNCQDWAGAVRAAYRKLAKNPQLQQPRCNCSRP